MEPPRARRLTRFDESRAEITRVMELVCRLAGRVRRAVDEGAFPLVLAGGCNSSLGTAAGIAADSPGIVWFDAHADFDDRDLQFTPNDLAEFLPRLAVPIFFRIV